jgi:hypothetical protein
MGHTRVDLCLLRAYCSKRTMGAGSAWLGLQYWVELNEKRSIQPKLERSLTALFIYAVNDAHIDSLSAVVLMAVDSNRNGRAGFKLRQGSR